MPQESHWTAIFKVFMRLWSLCTSKIVPGVEYSDTSDIYPPHQYLLPLHLSTREMSMESNLSMWFQISCTGMHPSLQGPIPNCLCPASRLHPSSKPQLLTSRLPILYQRRQKSVAQRPFLQPRLILRQAVRKNNAPDFSNSQNSITFSSTF
jgi:hypothetical protein